MNIFKLFGKKEIFLNGMSMYTYKKVYSYDWVCQLYLGLSNGQKWCPSITYRYKDGRDGILSPRQNIKIEDGMRFNAAMTGSA